MIRQEKSSDLNYIKAIVKSDQKDNIEDYLNSLRVTLKSEVENILKELERKNLVQKIFLVTFF